MLLSTAQLAASLNDPNLFLFDCRHALTDPAQGEKSYQSGHLPGAQFLHMDRDLSAPRNGLNGRHPLPAPADWINLLGSRGINAQSRIVAYDDVGGLFACRLWWMCRWIGLQDVYVLDGGISKWISEGRALTRNIPAPQPAAWRGVADPLMLFSADEVQTRLHSDAMCLIDARAPERFHGEIEPIDPVAGHIPGARNRNCKINLNADLTFRPAAVLREEFTALLGDSSPEQVVHQCGSGITACHNLFAMEYVGLTGSKLYAGSWSEWISQPSRPVERT